MPGGQKEQKGFIPEPQPESPDETENLVVPGEDEDDEEETEQETIPEGTDEDYEPYTEGEEEPAEDETEEENVLPADESGYDTKNSQNPQPEQLDEEQQAAAATALAASKQQELLQIAREQQSVDKQLEDLGKKLMAFRGSKLTGFFSIFQPMIKRLIDTLLEELKKPINHLSDEQKVDYYTGLITNATILINILTALKEFAALLDAIFSWFTKAIPSCVTCVGCVVLIFLAPLYIAFFAAIFMLGAIPLLKGRLTKIDTEIIKDLKKQRTVWQAELDIIKQRVTLRKQKKDLGKAGEQIKRQR